MVDISAKPIVYREATAVGEIMLRADTIRRIKAGRLEKGDPIQIAELAGIQGAKHTPLIILLCHPLQLEGVDVTGEILKDRVRVTATVKSKGKTGVEMEALTAVAASLLNIWDVVKAYEKDEDGQYPLTAIREIRVSRKVKEKIEASRRTPRESS